MAALLAAACSSGTSTPNAGGSERISRTESVKVAPAAQSAATSAAPAGFSFCEKLYAPGERPFRAPAVRPLKGARPAAATVEGWTYVNFWATWCVPCVEEMSLFTRWQDALTKDGFPINLELYSIDSPGDEDALRTRAKKDVPGNVRWVESEAAFQGFLESVGLEKTAAVPIHVLVDPAQNVRCVRVGAIHAEDFAEVKRVITQR